MSNIDKLASELKSLIRESDDRKPQPYDTDAQVVRVDDDTLWVHIPGGIEETPIKKTINAEVGDNIRVHIANGGAWISGNETAPPTDDRQAIYATNIAITADAKADEAVTDAERAKEAADLAVNNAGIAREAAESANTSANEAMGFAITANTAASDAITFASNAQQTANNAKGYLSEVENVVGVLSWIAQYGEYQLTQDEVIIEGKWYFNLDEQGNYVIVELDPDTSPVQEGVYELKEMERAIGKYVSSHLFLDGVGLHVSLDRDNGSELVLNGTSILMKDANGDTIAEYSGSVVLGNKANEQPYIELSPTNGLEFYQDTQTRVAHINQSTLFIDNAEITSSLRIGKFMWIVRGENRISLRYEPGEV